MIEGYNFGFAWLSVILTLLLCIVYLTKRMVPWFNQLYSSKVMKLDQSLRRPHKAIGVLLILSGLVHGIFSTESVFSFNLGTLCWLLSLLLSLNYLLKEYIKSPQGWVICHRILTLIFVTSIVLHIINVGGIQVFNITANNTKTNEKYQLTQVDSEYLRLDNLTLRDGQYRGTANAYEPELTVLVTIQNGKVHKIEVIKHNEGNSRYYKYPIQHIPEEILKKQSLDVDIVSGATFTSIGIKNAVINAIQGAVIDGKLPDQFSLPIHR